MVQQKLVCSSCNQRIVNNPGRAIFPCPNCGKQEIIRCSKCRKLAVRYKCEKCGFIGPN